MAGRKEIADFLKNPTLTKQHKEGEAVPIFILRRSDPTDPIKNDIFFIYCACAPVSHLFWQFVYLCMHFLLAHLVTMVMRDHMTINIIIKSTCQPYWPKHAT